MRMANDISARTLNSDLLRTFLAVADAGSFTAGARRIFRTQSAASLQIRQLEDLIGQPVFERYGRGVRLAAAGERLEPVARQVVGDLDRALSAFSDGGLSGRVRVGIPDEMARGLLSEAIGAFGAAHPNTQIAVSCAASSGFEAALAAGDLDIAVYDAGAAAARSEVLFEEPVEWAASPRHRVWSRDPLPVALFDRACWWRDAALVWLERAGRPYRIVYSSESVGGIHAALNAGIAVGVLARSSIGEKLVRLGPQDGFADPLPDATLVLRVAKSATSDPTVAAMADALRAAFQR